LDTTKRWLKDPDIVHEKCVGHVVVNQGVQDAGVQGIGRVDVNHVDLVDVNHVDLVDVNHVDLVDVDHVDLGAEGVEGDTEDIDDSALGLVGHQVHY